jgi:DNA repair protein RadA/Sms
MGVVSAIASSFLDRPIPDRTVVLGEMGLTGEVRAISHVDIRVTEIKKMGFTTCLLPAGNLKRMPEMDGIKLVGIKTVSDAVDELF